MQLAFRHLLQLIALSAFAVGQPLLDKLGNNPEFFIARRSEHLDFFYFAFALLFLVPGLLFLIELPFLFVWRRFARVVHIALLCMLVALTAMPVAMRIPNIGAYGALLLSLFVGGGFGLLFVRYQGLQQFCVALALTALAFPIFFLTRPGIKELAYPRALNLTFAQADTKSKAPIIFVLFDEFPLHTLLDAELQIDAARFPNFAALAKTAHWFRNASANSTHTTLAVPSILSGMLPRKENKLPTYEQHPKNLFTLVGDTHYLHSWEKITHLCPDTLCHEDAKNIPNLSERMQSLFLDVSAIYLNLVVPQQLGFNLPTVTSNWGGFWGSRAPSPSRGPDYRRSDRARIFRFWTKGIENSSKPVLHFSHHLLPHHPYQFTESGRVNNAPNPNRGYKNESWADDESARVFAFQQLLTQVGAVDSLLGQLIEHLKAQGIFDKSLIVITADHGVSFVPGLHRRGYAKSDTFFEDILSVPLIIKEPGQTKGTISDRNVQSIDILPSIIDLLDIDTTWTFDGLSAFSEVPAPENKQVLIGSKPRANVLESEDLTYTVQTFPAPQKIPDNTLRWKLRHFGKAPPNPIFRFSPLFGRDLLGTKVEGILPSEAKVQIIKPPLAIGPEMKVGLQGNIKSGPFPTFVEGLIHALPDELKNKTISVAVALNGEIVAVAPTYAHESYLGFQLLIPDALLNRDFNEAEFYVFSEQSRLIKAIIN